MATTNDTVLGKVKLYEDDNWMGEMGEIPVHKVNTCYNLDCFNNTMSSAKWDVPTGWHIGFYTGTNCRSNHDWYRAGILRQNVSNLNAKPKVINSVSSMIVLKLGAGPLTYTDGCPKDTVTGEIPLNFL